jgi:hypothetical protein
LVRDYTLYWIFFLPEGNEKKEHRTSNVKHRMMNKKTNIEQRMVIEEKDDEAKV